jgi:glucose-6-phosphate dehydrogenase assembly protein OpcA
LAKAVKMPHASTTTTIGSWEAENVTVGQVEAALSDLRRHEARAAVRTSVLTLVAVVDDQREADAALEVVYDLGARHPSRTVVLVVGDDPDGGQGIDAAASVHAVERQGTAMCYEDVVLRVRGGARYHLDSIVEPFTIPDLPVVVWIPAHLPAPGDPLLDAANSLVVDSRAVPAGGDVLRRISALTRRLPVNDLSWIRLGPWRSQLAGLFEGSVNRPFLGGVHEVEVAGNHGPRHLLAGWVMRRLRLPREAVTLEPAEHVSIRLTATSEGRTGRFSVGRAGPERVIESCIDIERGPCVQQTMRIRRQWPGLSLASALTRMSGDDTYRVALDGALELS